MVLGPGLSLCRLLQLNLCSMDENFELGHLSDPVIVNQTVTLSMTIYCWQDQQAGPVLLLLVTIQLEVLSATPLGHLFNLHS